MTEAAATPEPGAAETREAASLTAETLGKDLLEALLDIIQKQPTTWDAMTVGQQSGVIDQLRRRVLALLTDTLAILFKGDYPACVATVAGTAFKDGIKVTLDIAKTAHHRHELADKYGQSVVIVLADPDAYFARMEEVRGKQRQPDMFADGDGVTRETNFTGGAGPYRRGEGEDGQTLTGDEIAQRFPGFDPEAPTDLSLELDPAHQQAQAALLRVGHVVPDHVAKDWTEAQLLEAVFWAQQQTKAEELGVENATRRPAFLLEEYPEAPEPVEAGAGEAEANDSDDDQVGALTSGDDLDGLQTQGDQPAALTAPADELLPQALAYCAERGKGISASGLQRTLKIGYNRAARLLEVLEKQALVSPLKDAGGRDYLGGGAAEG
jgi:DNA translocase FtsK/SpoIIIE-like protein